MSKPHAKFQIHSSRVAAIHSAARWLEWIACGADDGNAHIAEPGAAVKTCSAAAARPLPARVLSCAAAMRGRPEGAPA